MCLIGENFESAQPNYAGTFFGIFIYTTLYLRKINDYRLIAKLNLMCPAEPNDGRLNMINEISREHSVQLLVRFQIRNIFPFIHSFMKSKTIINWRQRIALR